MTKINFGEGLRMNYIRYFNELSQTLNHELNHVWRIALPPRTNSRKTSRTSSAPWVPTARRRSSSEQMGPK